MPKSAADSSAGYTPSSYHYRTYKEPSTFCQQTPPYMAPTISSAMKNRRRPNSEGLHTALSSTPSRNRSHLSRWRLRQEVTSHTPDVELLTAKCNIANELNHQDFRRTSPQPLFRVVSRSPHCGGLYYKYLKPLYWDRITSKYNKISRDEHVMEEQHIADLAPMDIQNMEQQPQWQLKPSNSYQDETSLFHLPKNHLQQRDGIGNGDLTSSLCTAQVKTPCGWQRTFSCAPLKISRFDRFASPFMETVSSQIQITEAPLKQSPYYMSSETARYNIWQCISSNSPKKVSRFKRFWKREIKDMESQVTSQLEQSGDQLSLTESRMRRGLIWKRTIFRSMPQISRLDRFSVQCSSTNISRGNLPFEQFEQEDSLNSLETQSALLHLPRSPAVFPNLPLRSLSYEQAKPVTLREYSSTSNRSLLQTAQLRSSKISLTESLSSEELSAKHSNLIIKTLCEAISPEYCEKNVPLGLQTSETQSSEGSTSLDLKSYNQSQWERSKSMPQRISRSERFQKRALSTSSTASTRSSEAPAISKTLFSRVSTKKGSKTRKPLERTSRFDRFQKNTRSILSTTCTNSSLASILPETSSERPLSERSICNQLTAVSIQKSFRPERFKNSTSLDLRTARTGPSSSSFRGCLWTQTHKLTMNSSGSCPEEKVLNKNSRFKRFRNNVLPDSYTEQPTFPQDLSIKKPLKKQTEQEVPHKIAREKYFKTDRTASELMVQVRGTKYCPYDAPSLCSDSTMYSLFTGQQRSPEQSLTSHSLNSMDCSCKDMDLTDSTTQIMDSIPIEKLEPEINCEEQLENRAPTSFNMFNGIRDGKITELQDSAAVQKTQEVSCLDGTEGQYFNGK